MQESVRNIYFFFFFLHQIGILREKTLFGLSITLTSHFFGAWTLRLTPVSHPRYKKENHTPSSCLPTPHPLYPTMRILSLTLCIFLCSLFSLQKSQPLKYAALDYFTLSNCSASAFIYSEYFLLDYCYTVATSRMSFSTLFNGFLLLLLSIYTYSSFLILTSLFSQANQLRRAKSE